MKIIHYRMNSVSDSPLSETLKKTADTVILNSDRLGKEEVQELFQVADKPRFIPYASLSYESKVKKIGNTHGFGIPKNVAHVFKLQPGEYVEIILRHPPGKEPDLTTPPREILDRIYERHEFHFHFPDGVTLSDFMFEELGKKYYIPLYNKLSVTGTSYAFFFNLEVLELFGFHLNDNAELFIRKVSQYEKTHR